MKGKRIAAFALALVLGASAAQPALAADWQSKNPLIAHALGEADGKIETNSKEAFLTLFGRMASRRRGGFTYTQTNFVVRHDFEKRLPYYRLEIAERLSGDGYQKPSPRPLRSMSRPP